MVEKLLFGYVILDCSSSANRDRHLEEELLECWSCAGVAKAESATELPKCELIGCDIGKHSRLLHQNLFLQVAHSSAVINVDRKRTMRHIENPTEEQDGTAWVVHCELIGQSAAAQPRAIDSCRQRRRTRLRRHHLNPRPWRSRILRLPMEYID